MKSQKSTSKARVSNPKIVEIVEIDDQKSLDSKISRAPTDIKSLLSKVTGGSNFKTPNIILNDFKFEPTEAEERKLHPILGVPKVNNVFDLDWEALKRNTMQEWSSVC